MRGRAARWPIAAWCALAAVACNDGNRVADRVSCYPACLADIVQFCPMLSECNTADGPNLLISNPDIANGLSACFASGEKKWQATNATTGDSVVVVKTLGGGECYTAISQGASMHYTITVGGQVVAELNADTAGAPATVTCGGTTTSVVVNDHCFQLPWTNAATCEPLRCDFGALPPGTAAGAPPR